MDQVWEIFSRQLTYITWAYGAKIHSFVLMNNHFHLLISTPEANLPVMMQNFMRETSRYINEEAGRINQTYGARHFRTVISTPHYFQLVYKYVYYNPVAAGIASSCEDYKYSSLNFLLGRSPASFPIIEDESLFLNIDRTLKWLNEHPDESDWKDVGLALDRSDFKLARHKNSRKKSHLEIDLL